MSIGKKLLAALLITVLAASMLGISAFAQNTDANTATQSTATADTTTSANKAEAYKDYISKYANAARPEGEIVMSYNDHLVLNEDFTVSDSKLPIAEFDGVQAVISDDGTIIGWKINVTQSGLYNLKIKYYNFLTYEVDNGDSITQYTSKGSDISRGIYIDGKLPYYDARQINLTRKWVNETPVKLDEKTNNHLRPFQIELSGWQTGIVRDYLGYYSEPLCFYLEKGEHVIALSPISESFAISEVILYQYEAPVTYSELLKAYQDAGYTAVPDNDDTFIKIQAEDPSDKSDPTLYALGDRSTPSMEPYHTSKIRLNSIGGEKWQNVGSWMEWTFDVKTAGLYKIAIKAKQNVMNGANAHRRFMLDGAELTKETNDMIFGYTSQYVMYQVGATADQEYMLIYLDEGKHTIRMEITLGNLSDILQETEESLTRLNQAYRQILMLTGANPDPNRDYQFDKVATEALRIFKEENIRLKDIEQRVKDASDGKNSEQSSVLRKLIIILDEIEKRMDTIKERFSDLKDNIAALGTWINNMRQQPLQMDYIIVCSPDHELPQGDAGFFERLVHEVSSFIASFTEDYDSIGSVSIEDADPVDVWVETGAGNAGSRDNANVLKQIIDSRFTVQYNIAINLKLVAAGALLPATLAGNGPDVCLTRGSSDAVNYALRGAVVNLNDKDLNFEGKEEVFAQFHESALTPLRFRTGIYGLPETQDFNMLYYRTDVMEELGIDPETQLDTWDDIYKLLPLLQNKSMNFGMPVPVLGLVGGTLGIYATLLYQQGGELYVMSDEYEYDGISGNLDSEEALDAFKIWTNLFTVKRLPNSYDFANRFRSGEIPIAIAGYSAYNTLSVFAPEISGVWEFKKVPGTVQDDGTINYATAGGVSACVMMSTCKNKENAWKFMSWWTGTEAQALFGREIESLLGSAARYQTANMNAIEQLPWDKKSLEAIKDQWNHVIGIPEVPGSYYMGRNVEFAWKEVINTNGDSNLIMLEYSKIVNDEIARKRDEFKDKLNNKELW